MLLGEQVYSVAVKKIKRGAHYGAVVFAAKVLYAPVCFIACKRPAYGRWQRSLPNKLHASPEIGVKHDLAGHCQHGITLQVETLYQFHGMPKWEGVDVRIL